MVIDVAIDQIWNIKCMNKKKEECRSWLGSAPWTIYNEKRSWLGSTSWTIYNKGQEKMVWHTIGGHENWAILPNCDI